MSRFLWLIKGSKTYTVGMIFIGIASFLWLTNQFTTEFGIYLLVCEYALLSMTKRSAMPAKSHPLKEYI